MTNLDTARIDWLAEDTSRLEDVRGRMNNEGDDVRTAIDVLMYRRAPVQSECRRRDGKPDVPQGTIEWSEHLEVFGVYAKRYGREQSSERIAERGGFGYYEAEALLGRPLKTWKEGR